VVKSVTVIPIRGTDWAKLDGYPDGTQVATVHVGDAEVFKVLITPEGDVAAPSVPAEVLAYIKASVPIKVDGKPTVK
jgi:hypothetical protein